MQASAFVAMEVMEDEPYVVAPTPSLDSVLNAPIDVSDALNRVRAGGLVEAGIPTRVAYMFAPEPGISGPDGVPSALETHGKLLQRVGWAREQRRSRAEYAA